MTTLHTSGGAQALPLDLLLSAIPSLPRQVLDRLVERAIDRIDELDGDCDLEDDDPAGGNVEDVGECGTIPEAGGCHAYADDDGEEDDADYHARVPHIRRLHATRCDRTVERWGEVRYRLRDDRP